MMSNDTKRRDQPVKTPESPRWVKDMFDHFNKTGAYRAEDIERVLGDPRKSVEIKRVEELPAAAKRVI